MKGPGGMLTFVLKPSHSEERARSRARAMLRSTKLFACAESLGGVESLIEAPALMTHLSIPQATREQLGIADGLVRVSAGIEHIDDQIADLEQALVRADH